MIRTQIQILDQTRFKIPKTPYLPIHLCPLHLILFLWYYLHEVSRPHINHIPIPTFSILSIDVLCQGLLIK